MNYSRHEYQRSTLPDCVDVDIQEFYDTTLLDESKSVQQKTTETLQIVAKWEQTLTIAGSVPPQTTLQTEVTMHALLYATTSHSQLLLVVSLVYTVLNYRPTYYGVCMCCWLIVMDRKRFPHFHSQRS